MKLLAQATDLLNLADKAAVANDRWLSMAALIVLGVVFVAIWRFLVADREKLAARLTDITDRHIHSCEELSRVVANNTSVIAQNTKILERCERKCNERPPRSGRGVAALLLFLGLALTAGAQTQTNVWLNKNNNNQIMKINKTTVGLVVAGLVAMGVLALSGLTGCETTTATTSATNAVTGVVTATTVTNKIVNPAVIAVSAGVLQGATALGATYIIQNNKNDIVYLQGVQAALTLALSGTNVPPAELTGLLANVKVANPAVSAIAQSEMDSIATQYASAYGALVAQGIDANAVAGPLLNAVLNGLNASVGQ